MKFFNTAIETAQKTNELLIEIARMIQNNNEFIQASTIELNKNLQTENKEESNLLNELISDLAKEENDKEVSNVKPKNIKVIAMNSKQNDTAKAIEDIFKELLGD